MPEDPSPKPEVRPLDLGVHERRFRALIENAVGAIILVAPTGAVTFASASTGRLLGWDPVALIGQDPADRTHPDDLPALLALLAELMAAPGAIRQTTYRVRHADGSWRWVESTITNMIADPEVAALVFNSVDVTERRRLDAALAEALRLEAVGRLAGGVAHDFNNLLAVILGCSSFAVDQLAAHHPARLELAEIEHAANRAAALTRQLLAISRKQVLTPAPVELNHALAELREIIHRTLGGEIRVIERLHHEPVRTLVDRGQLDQVLLNLVVNARDAMPHGGTLTITTRTAALAATAAAALDVAPGEFGVLEVADDGIGMAPEVLARVFEPFFTTKAPSQGTGLGLSTVFGIARQSRGTIVGQSMPGRGTTFTVYLPRTDAAEPGQPTRRATPAVTRQRRLLVVDDDAAIRGVCARILASAGYAVVTADSGAAALAQVEAGPAIDLVLTDVVMPVMRGPELAVQLRRAHPEIKVLYMSGYADGALGDGTPLPPATTLVAKPFDRTRLLGAVHAALDAG